MKIVKQKRIKQGYELETGEGYVIEAKLGGGELGVVWSITAIWGESHESGILTTNSLGVVDPIQSTQELIKTIKLFDVEYDPTNLPTN